MHDVRAPETESCGVARFWAEIEETNTVVFHEEGRTGIGVVWRAVI